MSRAARGNAGGKKIAPRTSPTNPTPDPPVPDPETYVSTGEAARELGLTRHTLRNWILQGRLRPDRTTLGGHAQFLPETVRELARRMRDAPAA